MTLPPILCPNRDSGRLHPSSRPRLSDGYNVDINGERRPRYRRYTCDACGRSWTLDLWLGLWR